MPLQPLETGHNDRVVDHRLGGLCVIDPHPRPDPQKVKDAEATGVPAGSTRRKGVVGTGSVVSQDLGRAHPDEKAPVVGTPEGVPVRVAGLDLQVLRGDVVGDLDALGDVGALYGKALLQGRQGGAAVGFGKGVDLLVDLGVDVLDEFRTGAQQDGTSDHVVLGLGDEIGSDNGRVGGVVAYHQDLGRSGEHVDAALAADDALGGRDPHVSGAADDVAGGDGSGRGGRIRRFFGKLETERHGGNRLGSTDPQEDVGIGNVGRGKGDRSGLGAAQDNGGATRGAGRHGRHQDAGGEGVSSAGGVASGGCFVYAYFELVAAV